MKISVIIPARNKQNYMGAGLESIKVAQKNNQPLDVEVVVCLNRCNDWTEEIAKNFGAVIALEDTKILSKIRNTRVQASSGDIVVTIDAAVEWALIC